jgi:CRP-like cAMP-binding protein
VVQGTGTALKISTPRMISEFRRNPKLREIMFGATHLLTAQIAQTAACNRFHETSKRLVRWLLMTADRLHSNNFRLTHEFLGRMLGVPRVGVTLAASGLQRKSLITYSRGNITILDRKGLEAIACSCYGIVNRLYSRHGGKP